MTHVVAHLAGITFAALALAACGPSADSPTSVPSKPTGPSPPTGDWQPVSVTLNHSSFTGTIYSDGKRDLLYCGAREIRASETVSDDVGPYLVIQPMGVSGATLDSMVITRQAPNATAREVRVLGAPHYTLRTGYFWMSHAQLSPAPDATTAQRSTFSVTTVMYYTYGGRNFISPPTGYTCK